MVTVANGGYNVRWLKLEVAITEGGYIERGGYTERGGYIGRWL